MAVHGDKPCAQEIGSIGLSDHVDAVREGVEACRVRVQDATVAGVQRKDARVPVAHARQRGEAHQLHEQLVLAEPVGARSEIGDGVVEARRREIVEEIGVVAAEVLRSKLHVARLRGEGECGRREQHCDHRESSRFAFCSHSSRAGIRASPYSSVSAP